jgi:hypothetical protein
VIGLIDAAVMAWIIFSVASVMVIARNLLHAIQARRRLIESGKNGYRKIVAWASVRSELYRLIAMTCVATLGIIVQFTVYPRPMEVLALLYVGAAFISLTQLLSSVMESRDRDRFLLQIALEEDEDDDA